jgi:DNA repair protein RadC
MNVGPFEVVAAGDPDCRRPSFACRYVSVVREDGRDYERKMFRGSHDVYAAFRDASDLDREHFFVVMLDTKNRFVGQHLVSIGSVSAAIVHPREVLKAVILTSAAAVLFVHNHPSGDPTPSKEDLEITRRLREVCDLLGVRAMDHVIVGDGRYVSFVDDGYW